MTLCTKNAAEFVESHSPEQIHAALLALEDERKAQFEAVKAAADVFTKSRRAEAERVAGQLADVEAQQQDTRDEIERVKRDLAKLTVKGRDTEAAKKDLSRLCADLTVLNEQHDALSRYEVEGDTAAHAALAKAYADFLELEREIEGTQNAVREACATVARRWTEAPIDTPSRANQLASAYREINREPETARCLIAREDEAKAQRRIREAAHRRCMEQIEASEAEQAAVREAEQKPSFRYVFGENGLAVERLNENGEYVRMSDEDAKRYF